MGVSTFCQKLFGNCCGGRYPRVVKLYGSRLTPLGRSKDGLYDNVLHENEREAVADLLQYLENVPSNLSLYHLCPHTYAPSKRAETDFFSGDPLRALSTLVYSDNIDLQRSASLTFAEITERGMRCNILACIGRVLTGGQMCEKSTDTPSNPSFSCYSRLTLRYNGRRARRWAI